MGFDRKNFGQLMRFVFWGALNTGLSISIYAALVYLGFNIYFANAVAVFVSVFSGHFFNKKKVFKSSEHRTLRKYILLWICFYVVSSLLIFTFINLGIDKYFAAIFAGIILVPISFIVQKVMVFLPSRKGNFKAAEILK